MLKRRKLGHVIKWKLFQYQISLAFHVSDELRRFQETSLNCAKRHIAIQNEPVKSYSGEAGSAKPRKIVAIHNQSGVMTGEFLRDPGQVIIG